ncbi:MAG: hypothetical protein JSW50_03590 [Candidatus Latescibacterota bacterium]|nr:MAG: hypothetical protein JSW50_03590 [Candidatus Latescibacterota bacterium]
MVRQLLHAVFAVLMWVVFVYYWSLVVRRPMNPDTKMALTALTVLTVVTTIGLCIWIYHNIRLFRKFRDRRRKRRKSPPPKTDYLGRPLLMIDLDELRRANSIDVVIVTSWIKGEQIEQKIFKPAETTGALSR